ARGGGGVLSRRAPRPGAPRRARAARAAPPAGGGRARGRRDREGQRPAHAVRARRRPAAARPGRPAGSASRQAARRRRPRGHRPPHLRRRRARAALPRVGTHPPAHGRRAGPGADRLRASARHEREQLHRVGPRLLPGLEPPGAHHRRAQQYRREHRQLDPGPAAAQDLVLLGQPLRHRSAAVHAIRLQRPRGRPVQRAHLLRRRGFQRGRQAAQAGHGHRHAHLGRGHLAVFQQHAGRSRHRQRRRVGHLCARGHLADRRPRRRARHRGGQPSPRHLQGPGRAARGRHPPPAKADRREALRAGHHARVPRQVVQTRGGAETGKGEPGKRYRTRELKNEN
ncbi:MAG: hypothetical protein AMXMBFR83_09610, partial [Phycisphaerae bacterium]